MVCSLSRINVNYHDNFNCITLTKSFYNHTRFVSAIRNRHVRKCSQNRMTVKKASLFQVSYGKTPYVATLSFLQLTNDNGSICDSFVHNTLSSVGLLRQISMSPSELQNSFRVCLQTPQGAVNSCWWATTATLVNLMYPSHTALEIAARSAHIDGASVEFSMLHPVNTLLSSSVSRAAPTEKLEYGQ